MKRQTDPSTASRRHPIVVHLDRERTESVQLRIVDRITGVAGSSPFVYLHVVSFGVWMLPIERSPLGRRDG